MHLKLLCIKEDFGNTSIRQQSNETEKMAAYTKFQRYAINAKITKIFKSNERSAWHLNNYIILLKLWFQLPYANLTLVGFSYPFDHILIISINKLIIDTRIKFSKYARRAFRLQKTHQYRSNPKKLKMPNKVRSVSVLKHPWCLQPI